MKNACVVVLDCTGSMSGQEDRVVSSMNEYVETLPKKCDLTVFLFDSSRWDTFYEGKARDWKKMTREDYVPGQMTPLYDAIAKGIDHALKRAATKKTLIMIDTDGQENASKEHTHTSIKALVDKYKAAGWKFIFMAAGITEAAAAAVGATGMSLGMTSNMASYTLRSANYAKAGGQSMSYFGDDDADDKGKTTGKEKEKTKKTPFFAGA